MCVRPDRAGPRGGARTGLGEIALALGEIRAMMLAELPIPAWGVRAPADRPGGTSDGVAGEGLCSARR
jgi:hypothetical protein